MPKRKRTLPFAAFAFCCNNETEEECLNRGLFGGPNNLMQQKVEEITTGTPLLLYNTQSKILQGPFFASSVVGTYVEHAWGGNFPVQVYIDKSRGWRKQAQSCKISHLWQGKVIPEKYEFLLSELFKKNDPIVYDIDDVRALADIYDLEEVDFNPNSYMISFIGEFDGCYACKFDIYYTTGTVKTSLHHPQQGKTQLFRRNVNMELLEKIFVNPRLHTEKGYKRVK
jgi:hypothetical protein